MKHYQHGIEHDNVAGLPGHVEPVTHFDYQEVDRNLGLDGSGKDVEGMAADLLIKILVYVVGGRMAGKNGRLHKKDLPAATVRFIAFVAALRPDALGDASYEDIGECLGVSKQMISKAVLQAQKAFGVKFKRTNRGRENMSRSQKGHKNHNHGGYKQANYGNKFVKVKKA